MITLMTRPVALLLTLALAGPALAQGGPTVRAGDLVIEAPWSRATPGGAKVAAGYMRISNRGTAPDRLVGGSAAVATGFEVHRTLERDGVATMTPEEGGLVIPPGATVELKPGGHHAMLTGLARPLKEGETVQGTLVFERAGTVAITYQVGGLGARGASGGHHHH